jgi:hypothetical protein
VKPYQRLIREALMENYDRFTRPGENTSGPVNVSINPELITILEVVKVIHIRTKQ